MRPATLMIVGTLLLAGCGEPTSPEPGGLLPASSIAGPQDPFWKGAFAPVSAPDTGPGDLTFVFAEGRAGFGQPGALQFGRGLVQQTVPHSQPAPSAAYSADGVETWANLLALPEGGQVELRQVVSEASPPGGAPGLCAAGPTTWVAVGLRPGIDHPGSLSIAAFSGAEAPGPDADDSEVCAVYEYAIPG